jgi:hypothetical protein
MIITCATSQKRKKKTDPNILYPWPTNATGCPLPNKFSTNWRRYTRTLNLFFKVTHQHTKSQKYSPIPKELKHLMYTESRHKEFKQEDKPTHQNIHTRRHTVQNSDNPFYSHLSGHKCAHIFSVTKAQDTPHAAKHLSPSIHTLRPHLPGTMIYSA